MALLDWCSANGIRIHPNLRILHRDHDKKGIYVRAADAPILPEQSRKPGSFHERDIRSCFSDNVPYVSSVFLRGCQLS
jgi:hypothetical protein